MNGNEILNRHKKLLHSLSKLPKNILNLHHLDNVPEFVLHGLCNKNCFNLNKAAYFVENPDFDIIKGVAGFNKDESIDDYDKIWADPESFTKLMRKSAFNKKVRDFDSKSIKRSKKSYHNLINQISEKLGFHKPGYCMWDMKHYNHGLVVYEKDFELSDLFDDNFANSLYLLSFCPIH